MSDLSIDRIQGHLNTERYGRSLEVHASTESTMDDARQAAAAGAIDGHTIVADEQRAGRGAHGRAWDSPAGTDLYFSVVTRPSLSLAHVAPLTLATGLGVREGLAARAPGREVTVKWPNDVWIDGRKCAGILVETRTMGETLDAAIIGVGINVNRTTWPAELEGIATSLAQETGQKLDRSELLAALLGAIEHWVDRFVQDGLEAVVSTLNDHLALRGQRVRCDDVVGTLIDVAPSGAIRIETGSGTVELLAGTLVAR